MEWISVEDGMPQEYDDLNYCKGNTVSKLVIVAVTDDNGEMFVSDDITINGKWVNFPFARFDVTHWMPMPDHPFKAAQTPANF